MGGVKGGELGAEHSGRIARGGEGVIISPCLAETEFCVSSVLTCERDRK
jgi:hypothetical protein